MRKRSEVEEMTRCLRIDHGGEPFIVLGLLPARTQAEIGREKRGASDHLGAWDPRRRVHADSGHGRDYLSGVSEKTWDGGKSSTLWHVAPSGDCLSLLKTPNKAFLPAQN